jgi:hypothetical protein
MAINYSDLIGLRHKYAASPEDGEGFTDCWLLCVEVRNRLGLRDLREVFPFVYSDYKEEELTIRRILRWLLTYGEVTTEPRPGALFYLPGANSLLAMAVVADDGNCLFISQSKMVVAVPLPMVRPKKFFWAE